MKRTFNDDEIDTTFAISPGTDDSACHPNEQHLQDLAEQCTMTLATGWRRGLVSAEDALLVVLNMLRYHSSLVMDKARHDAFMIGIKALLQAASEDVVAN